MAQFEVKMAFVLEKTLIVKCDTQEEAEKKAEEETNNGLWKIISVKETPEES